MKKCHMIVLAIAAWLSIASTAQAEPPLLAMQRPHLLGSYVFAPVPVGLLTWQASDPAPGTTQAAATSDVVPTDTVVSAQPPYASAVTNVVAGNYTVLIPSSISGTTNGWFKIKYGSTTSLLVGPIPGLQTTYTGLYGGATTPTGNNYGLRIQNDGTTAVLSGTSVVALAIGSANAFYCNSSASCVATGLQATGLTDTGVFTVTGATVLASPQTIACGTGGTQTVAATPTSGLIVTSGTLASNCTIDFSTNATSGDFTLDMSGVTLGTSFGVIFKNGTSSSATFLSGSVITTGDTMAHVWTHGANTLAVTY